MKRIVCFLLLLALIPSVQADDKKKKKNSSNNATNPTGSGAVHSGNVPKLPHMGPSATHPRGAPSTNARSAPSMTSRSNGHSSSPQSHGAVQSNASGNNSNPLLRKGSQTHSGSQSSNALTGPNRAAGANTHSSNPLTQHNRQAGADNANSMARRTSSQTGHPGTLNGRNSLNLSHNAGVKGQRNLNSQVNYHNWTRVSHANYRVRGYHEVFHTYHPVRHDRVWYTSHYDRVVVVGGGYYYWDAGYWYPAWGYDPAFSFYVYDGPIYSYDNLPPDQVTMNVQTALQDQGYYTGEVDGLVGPQTREALGAYQTDHNLEVTSAVDEPTVEALGLTAST